MEQGSRTPAAPDGTDRSGGARRHAYMVPPRPGSIGEALRRDRLAHDLDQAEVASQLGFHQTKLSAYELGKIKNPPPDRLVALARLYGHPDHYYLDMGGWPSGAALVRQMEDLAGALVIPEPRAGLQDLVDTLTALAEPAFQRVAKLATDELTWQDERAAQQDLAPHTARDSA